MTIRKVILIVCPSACWERNKKAKEIHKVKGWIIFCGELVQNSKSELEAKTAKKKAPAKLRQFDLISQSRKVAS